MRSVGPSPLQPPVLLHSVCHRELEEQIVTAGKDISVVSDLDWITEGASNLINEMISKPDNESPTHQIFLLKVCRGLQSLGL